MIKKLKNLKPEEIRLLLAVSLCLIFLATTFSTIEGEGCSCLEHGYGYLQVENYSAWQTVSVKFNGPMVLTIQGTGYIVGKRAANSGWYTWAARATNLEESPGVLIKTGQVIVYKNEVSTIVIEKFP